MYAVLGWVNVALLALMTAPYWLRFLNKHVFHTQGGIYAKLIKGLRKVHKPLGLAVILIAAIHGYLALGALRLHTGTLLGTGIVLTAALGISFYRMRKKPLFAWHKRLALLVILLLLLHLLFPGAIYSLFRV